MTAVLLLLSSGASISPHGSGHCQCQQLWTKHVLVNQYSRDQILETFRIVLVALIFL